MTHAARTPRSRARLVASFALAIVASRAAYAGPAPPPAVPWHAVSGVAVGSAAFVDVALGQSGDGYALTLAPGGGTNAHVFRVAFTPLTAPALAAVSSLDYSAPSGAPTLAVVGAHALVSGNNQFAQALDNAGTAAAAVNTNLNGVPIHACALDVAGGGNAACGLTGGAGQGTVALSTTDGATFNASLLTFGNNSSNVTAVAVRGNASIAADDSSLLCGTNSLAAGYGLNCASEAPLSAGAKLGALATTGFVAIATTVVATAYFVADPSTLGVAAPAVCGVSGGISTRFSALALDGDALWIGDDAGRVFHVADPTTCPWVIDSLEQTTLASIAGLTASGTEILAVGVDGAGQAAMSFRNRDATITAAPPSVVDVVELGSANAGPVSATDPDGEAISFGWDCGSVLVIDNATLDTVTIHGPADDPALCPGDITPVACSVSVFEGNNAVPPADFTVNVHGVDVTAPVVTGVLQGVDHDDGNAAIDPAVPIDEGHSVEIAFDVAPTDNCTGGVLQWGVFDASDTLVATQADTPFDGTFPFTAPDAQGGVITTFTVKARAHDAVGNAVAVPAAFTFQVQPVPPPDVTLQCVPVIAGEEAVFNATSIGVTAPTTYTWTLTPPALSTDLSTNAVFTLDHVGFCDYGTAYEVDVTPHATRDGTTQTCTGDVLLPTTLPDAQTQLTLVVNGATPTLPGFERDVALDAGGAAFTLQAVVSGNCPQDVVDEVWRIDGALPAQLALDAASRASLRGDGRVHAATIGFVVAPADVAALSGQTVTFPLLAISPTYANAATVDVTLRFSEAADLGNAAHVRVDLADDVARGTLAPGDLVVVSGTVSSDLAVPLPALDVSLAGSGLFVSAATGSVSSECGAHGSFTGSDGGGAHIVLEGVTSSCPAQVRFLARRGLADGGVTVAACTWGADHAPLAACTGGVAPSHAAALSCANSGADASIAALAVVLCWRYRRRTSRARSHPLPVCRRR